MVHAFQCGGMDSLPGHWYLNLRWTWQPWERLVFRRIPRVSLSIVVPTMLWVHSVVGQWIDAGPLEAFVPQNLHPTQLHNNMHRHFATASMVRGSGPAKCRTLFSFPKGPDRLWGPPTHIGQWVPWSFPENKVFGSYHSLPSDVRGQGWVSGLLRCLPLYAGQRKVRFVVMIAWMVQTCDVSVNPIGQFDIIDLDEVQPLPDLSYDRTLRKRITVQPIIKNFF